MTRSRDAFARVALKRRAVPDHVAGHAPLQAPTTRAAGHLPRCLRRQSKDLEPGFMSAEPDLVIAAIVSRELHRELSACPLHLYRGGARSSTQGFWFFQPNLQRLEHGVHAEQHRRELLGSDLD